MPTKTTKTLSEIATSNPIGRALLTQLPALVEQITEYRVETFNAEDAEDANAYAERNHVGKAWYVLDENRRNINGGVDR